MTQYEPRWYWCELVDTSDVPAEPDWSKVPPEKLSVVRAAWGRKSLGKSSRVQLWGPQIWIYERLPGIEVRRVIGPVESQQHPEAA